MFTDSLGLRRLNIQFYPQGRFAPVTQQAYTYTARSVRKNDTPGIWRNPYADFLCSLLLMTDHTDCSPPAAKMQSHMHNVSAQGSPLKTHHSRILLDCLHRYLLPSNYLNSRLPKRRQAFSPQLGKIVLLLREPSCQYRVLTLLHSNLFP